MTGQPAATTSVALTNAAYVAVATAPWQVKLRLVSGSGARVYLGSSLPAVGTDNWFPIAPYEAFELNGVAGANVYMLSESATGSVRVVAA